MTLATLKGRLQTKLLTYTILAGVTALFSLTGNPAYLAVAGIAAVSGLLLESLWGVIITYQPGWLTYLLAFTEFGVIITIAALLNIPLTMTQAVMFYLAAWIPIQLFLLYLLPVWVPRWGDNGGELV